MPIYTHFLTFGKDLITLVVTFA